MKNNFLQKSSIPAVLCENMKLLVFFVDFWGGLGYCGNSILYLIIILEVENE